MQIQCLSLSLSLSLPLVLQRPGVLLSLSACTFPKGAPFILRSAFTTRVTCHPDGFFFYRLLFSNFVSSLPLVVYKPAPCTKLHWPRPGIHLILSSSLSFVCWFLCFAMGRRTLRATTPGRENYGGMLEQVRYFVL